MLHFFLLLEDNVDICSSPGDIDVVQSKIVS